MQKITYTCDLCGSTDNTEHEGLYTINEVSLLAEHTEDPKWGSHISVQKFDLCKSCQDKATVVATERVCKGSNSVHKVTWRTKSAVNTYPDLNKCIAKANKLMEPQGKEVLGIASIFTDGIRFVCAEFVDESLHNLGYVSYTYDQLDAQEE